ncbi:MAG: M67 family metallopeptidase [Saprospiraceae bacterium]|nr:M67 family metallopeptidase [Saprospiraceae bacterium]
MSTHIKTSTLQLSASGLEVVRKDAVKAYPDECCGFLFGTETEGRKITLAVPVTNHKDGDKRRRFEIHPQDYLRAERLAAEIGLDLLGVYHSHPEHPALPSLTDLEMALPYFSYVIVSVKSGKVVDERSWKLNESLGLFEEEFIMQPIHLS